MCQCVIKSNISWLCVFVCVYIIRLQQMQHHLSAVTLLINSVEMLPATRLTNTQPTPQTQVNINNHHRWHRFTGTAGLREGFMYQSAFTHINLFLWQIMRSIINTCACIISTVCSSEGTELNPPKSGNQDIYSCICIFEHLLCSFKTSTLNTFSEMFPLAQWK